MPGIYQPGAGSTIGALLRAIQEEKQASPLQNQPGSQVGSPIRELVQPPVFQPESPDSSRMIAIRPEGAMPEGGPMVVPPVSPEPVSPVAPVGPVGAQNIPGGSPQVQGGSQVASGRSAAVYSAPSIGTKITSNTKVGTGTPPGVQIVKKSSDNSFLTPTTSRVGGPALTNQGSGTQSVGAKFIQQASKALPKIATQIFKGLGKFVGGDSLAKLLTGHSLFNPKKVQ